VVADVASAAAASTTAVVYWAVAEPEAIATHAWEHLPNLAQGEGGLGARMGRVHAELVARHGAGLLLGADTPQLDTATLRSALAWCTDPAARQTIGPARDGGFWLYGANRTTPLERWEEVPYSRPDTARRLRTVFAKGGVWRVLPTLTDVDEDVDLTAMREELARLPSPLPVQRALAVWLDATFGPLPKPRAEIGRPRA
jgi:glycosyltransferase A (GT-A) superfamily protein (DUF2064 family)